MSKLTISQLKKLLATKTKDELITDIVILYQSYVQVKEHYQSQGSDLQEIVQKYKNIIQKEFITDNFRLVPKARFSVARQAVNDLKKLTKEPAIIADIMLTYVESASWFNSEYAPNTEEYYTRPENMFEQVVQFLKKHHLQKQFQQRAFNIVKNATEGWGHKDSLQGSYEEIYDEYLD